jgi:D-psicose/D-tagatose/L-ribulose 3-epimerase
MQPQNYELKNQKIRDTFQKLKAEKPERLKQRLKKAGVDFIELHGNHYGPDLGYRVDETRNPDVPRKTTRRNLR